MLSQPLICVADVQQTSAWFQRTLGFASAHGGPEYEQLVSNGVLVLQLHHWDAHPPRQNSCRPNRTKNPGGGDEG